MRLFNNDHLLVERIYAGDDQVFASLYEKYRDKFFGYFRSCCAEEKFGNRRMCRFDDGGAYLDDLYQNSLIKLYNQIMTAKMFAEGRKVYIRGKDGSINRLTASLETYLISIGKLTLKEMKRGESHYVDFDPIERTAYCENDPDYDFSSSFKPIDSSLVNIDPLFDISTDQELDRESTFLMVCETVKDLKSPCKEIFTYYFWENKTFEEIAQIMPNYSSADSVRNQKARCHEKFRTAYEQKKANI